MKGPAPEMRWVYIFHYNPECQDCLSPRPNDSISAHSCVLLGVWMLFSISTFSPSRCLSSLRNNVQWNAL